MKGWKDPDRRPPAKVIGAERFAARRKALASLFPGEALVIPTGPWQIDGSGAGERDLTPARLNAVRKFLTDRGIDSQRIFVESRTDAKIKEPRLDVQLLGQPATD